MHEDFWRARWSRNEIGFHLPEVNPWLLRHWPRASRGRVLVPLCGKSLDMTWLAGQGLQILGVELMETAVQAFFAEQGWCPRSVTTAASAAIARAASNSGAVTSSLCAPRMWPIAPTSTTGLR